MFKLPKSLSILFGIFHRTASAPLRQAYIAVAGPPKSKKYDFTGAAIEIEGKIFRQIICLQDITKKKPSTGENEVIVPKGSIGGLIKSEGNLSHTGTCWVHPGAINSGYVGDDAQIFHGAVVLDGAEVTGTSEVSKKVIISGKETKVSNSKITGDSNSKGVEILSGAVVMDSIVSENATIENGATVSSSEVTDNATVSGNVLLYKEVKVGGDSIISGENNKETVTITGPEEITGWDSNVLVADVQLDHRDHSTHASYLELRPVT